MTIALAALSASAVGLLIVVIVQIGGLKAALEDVIRRLSTSKSAARSLPAGAIEERLVAIERLLGGLGVSVERIEQASRRAERAVPRSLPPIAASDRRGAVADGSDAASPPLPPLRPEPAMSRPEAGPLMPSSAAAWPSSQAAAPAAPAERSGEEATPITPDGLVESYREIIAHPRKSEISRWSEQCGGLSCEATDDDAFQLVERGEGARLMLLPLTDTFALVLPSALTVVDFATDFSDVLSARSAFRRTFRLEADGRGTLRLEEPALATMVDGVWRLKVPGALSGLVDG